MFIISMGDRLLGISLLALVFFVFGFFMLLIPLITHARAHTVSGRHGFVVAITGIENIGQGLIREGTGFVSFPVKEVSVRCF